VNTEERAAALAHELAALGLRALLMGGHAVRFYGVDRSTVDYDFCLALNRPGFAALPSVLLRSPVIAGKSFREGPSWRPSAFRRFVVGVFPDGREERLEFWRENHLLGPFAELYARRTEGLYGGQRIDILGLDDLIRSKETEREDDWRDVNLLEEIADERRLAAATSPEDRIDAIATLRSHRGFERAVSEGLFGDDALVRETWRIATHPISRAYLLPIMASRTDIFDPTAAVAPITAALSEVAFGSARHLALVEAVRRLYRREAMAADRADKERYGSS
jgi:hypothetical protein